MTYYHYEVDDKEYRISEEDFNKIVEQYSGYNSFIDISKELQRFPHLERGYKGDSLLATGTCFDEIDMDATSVYDRTHAVIRVLIKSAIYGTFISCHRKEYDLHCGVVDGILMIRKVDEVAYTNRLERAFLDDRDLCFFILRNINNTDKKYQEIVEATIAMMNI